MAHQAVGQAVSQAVGLEIRLALPEDFPAIAALMHTNGLAIDGVSYATFTPPVLLACMDDQIIGFIQAILSRPCCVISEMAVDRAYQDQGIGSQLLHAMECLLNGMGYDTWVAFVGESRESVHTKMDHYGARCLGRGVAYMKNCMRNLL